MQFKNWPFGINETPVLYWMTSPRKNVSGWVMDAVFKQHPQFSSRIVRVEVPWGTLPYLRIGRTYYDRGRLDETSKRGLEGNLILLPRNKGKLIPAHAMPRQLRSFYGDYQLAEEMVWMIVDRFKTYYIPCLELVRAFLASSVYMANHILFPTAIEDMVSEEQVTDKALDMVLNSRIPTTIANNSTAFHIAWLRHNQAARQMWNGVLATQRYKARAGLWPTLEVALQSGIPLECEPPNDTNYVINFRGFYNGSNWLVQEITSVEGFDIPFEEVRYYHPLLKAVQFEDAGNHVPRTKTIVVDTVADYEMDNQDGVAKSAPFQPRVVISAVELLAKKIVRIKRVSNQARIAGRAKDDGQTKAWYPSHVVTTQGDRPGGSLRAIEVRGISFTDYSNLSSENRIGLKEFIEAVNLMQERQPDWNIQIDFLPTPDGTKISRYKSGERRLCAVLKITRPEERIPSWIIEVARPDNWPIATLAVVVSSKQPIDISMKENFDRLIEGLLGTDGHWKERQMNDIKDYIAVKRLKHGKNVFRWSIKIRNAIIW